MGDFRIRRAAVLGAGTMGSRIAAHLANAGIPCFLLDIAPPEPGPAEARNRIVLAGWNAALQSRPPALFTPELGALVQTGNFPDHLPWVREADWILEAVTERLDVKRGLLEQVEQLRKPGTIVSTNTSGIQIGRIAEGFPDDFRRNFLGTHFFNPPRYLRLLELIPTPDTDPALVAFMTRFGQDFAGQGNRPVQGHAEFHREPDRHPRRVPRPAHRGRRGVHGRGGGRADGPADRPAQERHVPHLRHRRPGHLRAGGAQPVRGAARATRTASYSGCRRSWTRCCAMAGWEKKRARGFTGGRDRRGRFSSSTTTSSNTALSKSLHSPSSRRPHGWSTRPSGCGPSCRPRAARGGFSGTS